MVRAATDRERNHRELHSDSQYPGESTGPLRNTGIGHQAEERGELWASAFAAVSRVKRE